MTEQQHPITPPPELVQQWRNAAPPLGLNREQWIATQAARWGADLELEACCGLIGSAYVRDQVRTARRPKPPSLAEEALTKIDAILGDPQKSTLKDELEALELSRAALKRLQELKSNG